MNNNNTTSFLSKWAKSISLSPTMQMSLKVKEAKLNNKQIYDFTLGEPEFDTPQFIKNECINAIEHGYTKYVASAGILELRNYIAKKYIVHNNMPWVTSNNVLISPGAKFSCYLTILSLCSPNDEVILPAPYWTSYYEMIKLSGAIPVVINTEEKNNFKITVNQIKKSINNKTKLIILNNPGNPTGSVYNEQELQDLTSYLIKNNIYILSDEIYEYFVYNNMKHISPASFSKEAFKYIITISGYSKTYAMTGWRMGITIASKEIINAMNALQSQTVSHATSFAQYGSLSIYKQKTLSESFIKDIILQYEKRRNTMFNLINNIDGLKMEQIPDGAFYLFVNIENCILNSNQFAEKLFDMYQVAVVPGIAFGNDNYIRLSYTKSLQDIIEGCKLLGLFCKKYKK